MLRISKKFLNDYNGNEKSCLQSYLSATEEYYRGNKDIIRFVKDEINVLRILIGRGESAETVIKRLNYRADTDFFRKNGRAYPLDTAAKLYPLVMGRYSSAIFRLSAWLREDIYPEFLQCALNRIQPRFPAFSAVLKKGVFWHYLDGYNGHCRVMRDGDVPCSQILMSGTRSVPFRVVYFKNRIGVEFFHALTDGTGGLIFLKTLLGEYFRLLGISFSYTDQVLDVCDRASEEELCDGFKQVKSELAGGGMEERRAAPICGKLLYRRARVYHFILDAEKLKAKAKQCRVTVTALLTGYILRAGKDCTEGKGLLRVQIPVNVRKFYGLKTFSNCAMFACVEKDRECVSEDEIFLSEIDRQLKERTSKENMERSVVKACKMVQALNYIPLFLKRPAAQIYDKTVTKRSFTQTLSNLGVTCLPDGMAEHVEMLDFIIGSPSKNAGYLSSVTCNGKVVLSYTTTNRSRLFEEKLYEYLSEEKLVVKIYGGQNYAD